MSRPRHPEECENGEELHHCLAHKEGFTCKGGNGSHEKWQAPDGTIVVITRHRKPMGRGLKHALCKALAAFFTILILFFWYSVYFA